MNLDMITGSQIEAYFIVAPETGEITSVSIGPCCKQRPRGSIKPGTRSSGGGYRMLSIPVSYRKYKKIRAHHLVWAWVHGEWPTGEIDHINGNRDDNRISNLRLVTISQNRTNKIRQSNNKSGFKWVYKCCQTGKWRADVVYRDNGVKKRFRTFGHDTPDAAYEIASNFAKSAHGKFYNPGKHQE